ncbi:MAG TPA: energy transducer TonB [Azonexus sp.]
MTRTDYRLALALILSLLAHLLPALPELLQPAASPPPGPPPLQAQLRPPPAAATPPLTLPEPAAPASPPPAAAQPAPAKAPAAKPGAARSWQQEIARQFSQQLRRGEFYPAEAIVRGLEGEVLVLLVLAPDGSVAAARVERSSGHRLLDEAALQAVRALRSLPADAPRETVLPVRFRLD